MKGGGGICLCLCPCSTHTRYRWKLRWYQRGVGGGGAIPVCLCLHPCCSSHTLQVKTEVYQRVGGCFCLHPCCSAHTLQVKTEVVWRRCWGGGGSVCVCALVAHTRYRWKLRWYQRGVCVWGGGGGERFLSVCVCTLVVAHTLQVKTEVVSEVGGVSVSAPLL